MVRKDEEKVNTRVGMKRKMGGGGKNEGARNRQRSDEGSTIRALLGVRMTSNVRSVVGEDGGDGGSEWYDELEKHVVDGEDEEEREGDSDSDPVEHSSTSVEVLINFVDLFD